MVLSASAALEAAPASAYRSISIENKIHNIVIRRMATFAQGRRSLTLGYAHDDWPAALLDCGMSVDIVDLLPEHCAHARELFAGKPVEVFESSFETFAPQSRYDTIVAGSVIEMVADPAALLTRAKNWLTPEKGLLIVTTPNAWSLHRRLGALLGYERHPQERNVCAMAMNAYRLYDRYTLRSLIEDCGYRIDFINGLFLKPFSSEQMADYDDKMLHALMNVGDECPDMCKELVAIVRLPTG